ncbi:MAG: 4-alpha-glucanotransferase [Ruminococcaceae bacterium]|nr:4-alpha-glucanotransferase [Oscillospiraceae bacterium]
MKRSSGVLMHISSLFGDYSIGSFSEHAKYFIDFLSDCGFSYWQVLPFSMADAYNSPYKSYSAFGGNPYFVDLEALHQKGLLTKDELDAYRQHTPYSCEYDRLNKTRAEVLLKAANRAENRAEIEEFIRQNPYLEQFCRFMALKDVNEQKCWIDWEREEICSKRLFLWQFIQFEFFSQWKEIKSYANSKGIKIIGDLPFYVAYDSADVWANPELFLLDESGRPTHVAGVPPDYFTPDGQLWGNPLYDWNKMESEGFSWWQARIRHMLSLFDGVRIDHFRALSSYWMVPAESDTAREGIWGRGPGEKLVDKIKEIQGEKLVIAEDLGEITEDVTELLAHSGFPGMRVLQFGFLGEDDSTHLPHNYSENCVAYTGTHDNNTLLGYVWELSEAQRTRLFSYCGYVGTEWTEGCDSVIRALLASHASLAIFPIQDLLGFGRDTRMNVPGRAEGNWGFRLTKEQLDGIDREKYYNLNKLYKRI